MCVHKTFFMLLVAAPVVDSRPKRAGEKRRGSVHGTRGAAGTVRGAAVITERGYMEYRESYCGANPEYCFLNGCALHIHGGLSQPRCQALCIRRNCTCFDWRPPGTCRLANSSFKIRATVHGHTAWAASGLPRRRRAPPPRVKVCIVGGVRSFTLPVVHASIRTNVIEPLRSYAARVDVTAYLLRSDSGSRFQQQSTNRKAAPTPCDLTAVLRALRPVRHVDIGGSTCEEFRAAAGRPCRPNPTCPQCTQAWLQVAWIDQCFRDGSDNYTHFVRMRPDSYFASPIPDLRFTRADAVTSWLEHDAKMSDQFYVVPRQVYQTWWIKEVRGRLLRGSFRSPFPENIIFRSVAGVQATEILGCLARNRVTLSCWRGIYGNGAIASKFASASAPLHTDPSTSSSINGTCP